MRHFLFLVLLAGLLACGISSQQAPPPPVPTPVVITFGGDSEVTTESFNLSAGRLNGLFSHRGDGRFYAVLLDSADNRTVLIDTTGRLTKSETYTIETAGLYRLDIFSQSGWTIQLEQP